MSESTVVLTYGSSGTGKTTDAGYSFPGALFAAAPGALNSVESVCGYKPATVQVDTIEDATKLIKDVSGKYAWLVIDDFSFMAEQTFSRLEKRYTGYKMWGALRDVALQFRDTARYANVSVVMTAWEQAPKTNMRGAKVRGGPMLSGRLPEQIPAMCDLVLRVAHDARRQPWPSVYRCYFDPAWVMKDRYDIAAVCDPAPMNLAEILRAAGIHVERHPELPDQEEVVSAISGHFQAAGDGFTPTMINEFYRKLLDGGMDVKAARWTLRDAVDRTDIRRAMDVAANTFIDVSNPVLL